VMLFINLHFSNKYGRVTLPVLIKMSTVGLCSFLMFLVVGEIVWFL